MDITEKTVLQTFMYHPPTPEQQIHYGAVRAWARFFAEAVLKECPPSAERTLALRKIQEGLMWANASIALNEPSARAIPPSPDPAPPPSPPTPAATSAPSGDT